MKSDVQGTGQDTINNVDEQPQDVSRPLLDMINYKQYMSIL